MCCTRCSTRFSQLMSVLSHLTICVTSMVGQQAVKLACLEQGTPGCLCLLSSLIGALKCSGLPLEACVAALQLMHRFCMPPHSKLPSLGRVIQRSLTTTRSGMAMAGAGAAAPAARRLPAGGAAAPGTRRVRWCRRCSACRTRGRLWALAWCLRGPVPEPVPWAGRMWQRCCRRAIALGH
jgi:hypothetical protein